MGTRYVIMQTPSRMLPRSLLLPTWLVPTILCAQVTAGEAPPGGTILDFGIDLQLNLPNTVDSADIEIDCDDFLDLRAILVRNEPAADGPNFALLRMVDDDLEFCMDPDRPRYYTAGEPVECTGENSWVTAGEQVLGDYGGFFMIGPATVDSLYVGYRRGSNIGWILLSFDLTMETGCRLQVHRALSICLSMGIQDPDSPSAPALSPNPTHGQDVQVLAPAGWLHLELTDVTGRVLGRYGAGTRSITAPATPGIHLVRLHYADGSSICSRLVRL